MWVLTFSYWREGMDFMRNNAPPWGTYWDMESSKDAESEKVAIRALRLESDTPSPTIADLCHCNRCGNTFIRSDGLCENCDW